MSEHRYALGMQEFIWIFLFLFAWLMAVGSNVYLMIETRAEVRELRSEARGLRVDLLKHVERPRHLGAEKRRDAP